MKHGRPPARRARPCPASSWTGKGGGISGCSRVHPGLAAAGTVAVCAAGEPVFGGSELDPTVPRPLHDAVAAGRPAASRGPTAAGGALDLQLAQLAFLVRTSGGAHRAAGRAAGCATIGAGCRAKSLHVAEQSV